MARLKARESKIYDRILKKRIDYLIIGIVALIILVHPLFAELVNSPTIPQISDNLPVIQNNSLKGYLLTSIAIPSVLGAIVGDTDDFKDYLRKTYSDIGEVLICMWKIESTYGANKNIKGDNGLAYGDFQIHINEHPISEECAMNFKCSADYTAKMIRSGEGYLWTSFPTCQN